MAINLCTVTGQVLRPDSTPFANGEIAFASVIPQVVQGIVVPITNVIATTDINGNINGGSGVSLIQGLALTVSLSLNGNFNSQFTTIIPNTPSSTFANIASGLLSLNNPLPVTTGTWTPTLATRGGVQPTVTYTGQTGYFALIGGVFVMLQGSVVWSSTSGGTGTQIGLGNFPVTVGSMANNFNYAAVQANSFTYTAGYTYLIISPLPGDTFAALIQCGSAQQGQYLNATAAAASGSIASTMVFRTA